MFAKAMFEISKMKNQDKKIETRTSVGLIPHTIVGEEIKYLLLQSLSKEYWEFPKGKQEEGESELKTLNREIIEETNICNFKIHPDFEFNYSVDTDTHKRKIKYFLGRFKNENIKISKEHSDFKLCSYEEARSILIFPQLIRALDEANEILTKNKINDLINKK